ncbi:hypothetical protein BKI52_39165 [marine bacterium AO1-C]|nr:hypothetical protein BKI52_39165 [marine bacterium AO1-C]
MLRNLLSLKRWIGLLFITGIFVHHPSAHAQNTQKFSKDIDAFITEITQNIKELPGLSVVVVKGDKAVFMKGYGYADIANKYPVQVNTPYYIASSTKSFMGMAASILDHQGKVKLDATLEESMPYIKFKPEVKANEIKLKQLLNHTSGISNGYFGFRAAYSGNIDRNEMNKVLESKTKKAREIGQYSYTNFGYNVYTHMTDKKLGKPWQDVLNELIFQPLNMKRTTAYMSLAQKNGWKYAKPYAAFGKNAPRELYLMKKDNTMQSAGGLITTVEDMANWLVFNLNEGKFKGQQIVPAQVVKMAHSKLVEQGRIRKTYKRDGYGLGWETGSYNDKKIIQHDGGFAGFACHVIMMPEEKIGITVLVNEGMLGIPIAHQISQFAFDWWLSGGKTGKNAKKMVGAMVKRLAKFNKRIEAGLAKRAKRTWQLTEPLKSYTGTYYNKDLGETQVKITDGVLEVLHGNLRSKSTPFVKENSIRLELVPNRGWVALFKIEAGKKASAIILDGDEFKRIK